MTQQKRQQATNNNSSQIRSVGETKPRFGRIHKISPRRPATLPNSTSGHCLKTILRTFNCVCSATEVLGYKKAPTFCWTDEFSMTTKSSGLHSRLLSVAFDGSIHRISLLHSKRLPDQTRYHILTIKLKLFFTEFSNIFRLIVPTMYLKATCIALLALSVGARSQETLSCNDVPDLMAFCETECGDSTLKDVECSATGPSCFCLNAAGDIENTNINAPTLCGGEDLSEACAKECGTVSQIEGFDCKNDKPVCTCAKDDGIEGLGDDVSEEDSDYADAKDAEAEKIAAELEENPLPVPPSLTMEDVAAAVAPAATTEVTPAAMAPAASEDAAPSTEPEAPAGSGSMIAGIVTALMVSAAGLVIA